MEKKYMELYEIYGSKKDIFTEKKLRLKRKKQNEFKKP